MDLTILGEYALKPALNVGLRLKKLYTSEVDDGIIAAFEFALNDWSKHAPTTSDKVRLSKALEGYVQNATSYEALDPDTRAFIDYFKKRLSEQPAAHNDLMTLRADMQAKVQEQILLEQYKTQDLIQGLIAQMGRLNMTPKDIRALLKELPLEQGLERTESALEEMCSKGRISSVGVKQIVLEFVRFLFEHTGKISEEAKRLREAGDSYLAETLEEIKSVLTGESEQSLTAVYEKHQEQAKQNEIRVLKELIEAAQIQFSFGEARKFYERLIELAPTSEHHFNYAYLLQSLNDFEGAKSHYKEVLQELRELAEQNPEVYKPDVAMTLNNLGILFCDTNDFKQSRIYYEEALQLYQELSKQNPEAYKPDVAMTLNNLGEMFKGINDLKQAYTCYKEGLQLYQEFSEHNPEAYKPNVAKVLSNLGILLKDTEDLKQAQAYYEEALQIHRELSEQNPDACKSDLAIALNNLGNLLRISNDLEQAQGYLEEALQIRRELSEHNPEAYNPDMATTLQNLSLLYQQQEKKEDAEQAYQEAHDIYQELASRYPRVYGINYAKILVIGLAFLGKPKEDLEEAKEILGKYPEHPTAQKLLSRIEQLGKR